MRFASAKRRQRRPSAPRACSTIIFSPRAGDNCIAPVQVKSPAKSFVRQRAKLDHFIHGFSHQRPHRLSGQSTSSKCSSEQTWRLNVCRFYIPATSKGIFMDTGNFPQPRMPLFRAAASSGGNENSGKPIATTSARSVGNVESWNSYLPADCVSTMIELGWDKTT